ncbi:MAG: hypothetical protein LBT25_11520 [Candidatus Symbiothrix sp.]|jgi:hypothetical protein|nr:hypothetical protein [Candidatus Symbiothrix sp.]
MEYKISKGLKIFVYSAAVMVIVSFIYFLILPFKDGNFSPNASWILIPISIGMIILTILGVIDAHKGRIIIKEDRIISIDVLGKKELMFDEIKGYIVKENGIIIEPINNAKKRIKISRHISGLADILDWHLCDFDNLEMDEEEEVLNNEKFGWRKEIREKKLANARKISKIINWVAWLSSAWAMFFQKPYYQLALLSIIIIPIIALFIAKKHKGMIKIDEQKTESKLPSVFYAFFIPSCVLAVRAILDYNIFNFSNLWILIVILTIVLLFLRFFNQRGFTFKKNWLIVLYSVLFFMTYSFGTIVHLNCFYDKSKPETFTVKIISKRMSASTNRYSESTWYYFKLSPWGQQTKEDEVKVNREFYNEMNENDEVKINFRKGKLGVSWFMVTNE